MDLTDYIRAETIDCALRLNKTLFPGGCRDLPPDRLAKSAEILRQICERDPAVDRGVASLITFCEMIHLGSKVIRPTLAACNALAEVDLNLTLDDYAQPYHGLGIILPAAVVGSTRDELSMLWWRPKVGLMLTVHRGDRDLFYAQTPGTVPVTIEEHIGLLEHADLSRLARISMNLALFAMERATLLPLSPKEVARKKRAAADPRMARLAARDAQELVVQGLDLIIREAAPSAGDGPQGLYTQKTHRRRGHWKMQACGPRKAERKRIYVSSYLVNATADQRVDTVLT